jgi:23S rRNA-/tRNA-specific pseudouridylate synthase
MRVLLFITGKGPRLTSSSRFVVVDKPASIPVHPCGRYRHLTLVSLLGHERGLWNLYPCHRLDRLTSGILIFARDKVSAAKMEVQIRTRAVHKEYICRVLGRFPEGATACHEPVLVVNHKVGVCCVSPQGKACTTDFHFVRYDADSDTSIVRCM